MKEVIVSVRHLSQRYGERWVVKDMTFDIPAHGITGLLGANGAGKSTTMNMICGVLNPTEGEIWINGANLKMQPEEARRYIGFLPQQPPLYVDLTVEEYLTHCAHLHLMKPTAIAGAVKKVMEKCSISHFAGRVIKSLSGGYQQRVGIAQAIIHEPLFVVLDEPTNGLDPNQIVDVRNLIRDIAKERAVLLSTHILPEIEATCQEIRMIKEGKLVFSGTMDDFNNYIEPSGFVLKFAVPPGMETVRKLVGDAVVERESDVCYRVQSEWSSVLTQKVIKECVAEGIILRSVMVERCSLNEIFARLSGERIYK